MAADHGIAMVQALAADPSTGRAEEQGSAEDRFMGHTRPSAAWWLSPDATAVISQGACLLSAKVVPALRKRQHHNPMFESEKCYISCYWLRHRLLSTTV